MKKNAENTNNVPNVPEQSQESDFQEEHILRMGNDADREAGIQEAIASLTESEHFLVIALHDVEDKTRTSLCSFGHTPSILEALLEAISHNPKLDALFHLILLKTMMAKRESNPLENLLDRMRGMSDED